MPTVETHIIGVGTPDPAGYTTIAAWLSACPASLVTADKVWRGELMAQTFAQAQRSYVTTDATRYIELTTTAGASFLDDADVRTNPLRYDATKGAAIEVTSDAAAYGLNIGCQYTRVSKIQFKNKSSENFECLSVGKNSRVSNGLFEHKRLVLTAKECVFENCVVIMRSTGSSNRIADLSGAQAYNCTFVNLSTTLTYGLTGTATTVLTNCYVGGASAPCYAGGSSAWTFASSACSGTPPSSGTQVAFSEATFENVTDGTHDLRLKSGSPLVDAGTTDVTYGLSDISGQTRTAPWDIGAWEFASPFAGGALSGAAQAVASASGTLAVDVAIGGAALSVATANGALSTAMVIDGVAAAIASASGTLTLGMVLSGVAIAKSVVSGALGTRFNISGAATAHAGASGNESSAFPLSGVAAGQAGATGHLTAASATALTGAARAQAAATGAVTVQFALSGVAVAKASASGALVVGGTSALAGTAQAVPAASGALSVSIPLAGSAQVVAGVTGNLTTGSPLAGAAVAVAAAAGNLMVIVKLFGAALAQAMASGGLSMRIPLSATAIAHANASGVLSGGAERHVSDARYTVRACQRDFTVRARPRNFTVTHAH